MSTFTKGLRVLGVVSSLLGNSAAAWAGPALIILEDSGLTNSVERRVVEGLSAVVVSNNLAPHYDRIDLLQGDRATSAELFARIRSRAAKSSAVDVMLLTREGAINVDTLRAAGRFSNLRMVYSMNDSDAAVVRAWTAAGAQVAIAPPGLTGVSGLFFPRFVRRWSEGWSVVAASGDAYRFANEAIGRVGGYVLSDEMNRTPIASGEPLIDGVDVNRFGQIKSPGRRRAAPPMMAAPDLDMDSFRAPEAYRHSDFEDLSIRMIGGSLPHTPLDPDKVSDAQTYFDRVKDPAWSTLRDSFPAPVDAHGRDETWIDGEALRYFMAPLKDWAGAKLDALIDHVQGARLERVRGELHVAVYFDRALELPVEDEATAKDWTLYAIHVPKTMRFVTKMDSGIVTVSGLADGLDALQFKVKLPYLLPDSVYLRNATVNLSSGKIRVEAGVIGNLISVVANAELHAKRFDGIDVWGTIKRNADLWIWPTLTFGLL